MQHTLKGQNTVRSHSNDLYGSSPGTKVPTRTAKACLTAHKYVLYIDCMYVRMYNTYIEYVRTYVCTYVRMYSFTYVCMY